jgi:hypothetical protein
MACKLGNELISVGRVVAMFWFAVSFPISSIALVNDTLRQEVRTIHQVHLQTCNEVILLEHRLRLALRSNQGP